MAREVVKDLFSRRVPQILGLYLGVSWAVVEFVGFLVDHYLVSPHLIDLAIVVLASLLPTVTLLAYLQSQRGADRWTALVYCDMGDRQKALNMSRPRFKAWEEADLEYIAAQRARQAGGVDPS